MLLLPPGVAPSSVTRLALDVSDAPGVLLRVLGICQRRGSQLLAMTYAHPRLELSVSDDERHLQLLRGRLENAIDVLAVDYAP